MREVVLWLLRSAPGLPMDSPLSFGDLGAGTCAACLGARFALRDHSGGEHPFKVWPIDMASSSDGFRDAFIAMADTGGAARCGGHTKAALLPTQHSSQYLTEDANGVTHLATSLLRQIAARGERQPHVLMASFSLHYLKRQERADFYDTLARTVTRPLLLLIIKGVDSVARHKHEPMVPEGIPSFIIGVHYYIGRNPKPRVVEAQLALIRPISHANSAGMAPAAGPNDDDVPPYDRSDPDSWVLSTFAAARRHSRRHGLFTGVTMLAEEKLAARELS